MLKIHFKTNHPFVVNEFCEIIAHSIRQNKHTIFAFLQLLCCSKCASEDCTRRTATQNAFLQMEFAGHLECVRVARLLPKINVVHVQHGWDKIVANALHQIMSMFSFAAFAFIASGRQNRAKWINTDNLKMNILEENVNFLEPCILDNVCVFCVKSQ